MYFPFTGHRNSKPDEFVEKICTRLGLPAKMKRTNNAKKGHELLLQSLQSGIPAYIFVDMAYLKYFAIPEEAHFGAHTVTVFGIDAKKNIVSVADRSWKALSISMEELFAARNSRYKPFPPANGILVFEHSPQLADYRPAIKSAILESCGAMLRPAISNFGLRGIAKLAKLMKSWPRQFPGYELSGALFNFFIYSEIGGTGGGAFRLIFARFLNEAARLLERSELKESARTFFESGERWRCAAAAALPDFWPRLRSLREISCEKNRLFEESPPGWFEKQLELNKQFARKMEELQRDWCEKLAERLAGELSAAVSDNARFDREAFEQLERIAFSL
jgi:hypothetical protein